MWIRPLLPRELKSCETATNGNDPGRKRYIQAANGEKRHLMLIASIKSYGNTLYSSFFRFFTSSGWFQSTFNVCMWCYFELILKSTTRKGVTWPQIVHLPSTETNMDPVWAGIIRSYIPWKIRYFFSDCVKIILFSSQNGHIANDHYSPWNNRASTGSNESYY